MLKSSAKRLQFLDSTRGVAVILMVLDHTIVFFTPKTHFLRMISNFCDVITFTIFFFISGSIAYLTILNHPTSSQLLKKLVWRILSLILCYYLLAITTLIPQLLERPTTKLVTETLLLRYVPGFTEFFLPFILFLSCMFFIKRYILPTSLNLDTHYRTFSLFMVSVFLFIIGSWLHHTKVSNYSLNDHLIFSLFFGGKDIYRFPILQYSIVFITGILFAPIASNFSLKRLFNFCFQLCIITLLTALALQVGGLYQRYFISMERWPPSFLFIMIGIIFTILLSVILYFLKIALLHRALSLYGINSLLIVTSHLLIIRFCELLFKPIGHVDNPITIVFIFVLLLHSFLVIKVVRNYITR